MTKTEYSMVGIEIREMHSSQNKEYKEFFMEGLVADEKSFRISQNDELSAPFPTLNQMDSFTLAAYVNHELAGVVSFLRDGADREKLRHKGTLFRMYVSPKFRGLGLSKLLMGDLISRVRQLGNIEQINLTVVASNLIAKRTYEKLGFKTFGSEVNAIKWKGEYFTEDQMVLNLL